MPGHGSTRCARDIGATAPCVSRATAPATRPDLTKSRRPPRPSPRPPQRKLREAVHAKGEGMARLKIGFIPIEGGHYYREALEEVTRAEELGFDSVWMEEHHAVTNHYWPSPLTVLAGFATRTSRMVLGTNILVAPFYHPVRLA